MYEMACGMYEMPQNTGEMKVVVPALCLCEKIINFVS